jgi:hypothetical protein
MLVAVDTSKKPLTNKGLFKYTLPDKIGPGSLSVLSTINQRIAVSLILSSDVLAG